MRITDLLSKESIKLNLSSKTKPEVIDEMVDLVNASGNLNNKEEYKKAIIAREEMSTTGIGEGVAIPHAKTKAVNKACLAAGVSKDGIDYESFDGSLYVNILDTLYLMEEVPEHESFSKEFDDEIEENKPSVKKKYIPPMTHPWKRMSFNNYVQKQKHRSGANV